MLTEWLAREGWMVLNWWLMATLAGAAVLPLCARFLRHLPDCGWLLSRAIGLVLTAYTLWILTALHVLRNTPVGIAAAWLIVVIAGVILYRRGDRSIQWRAWWKQHRLAIVAGELVFALAFFGWSLYRSSQNELLTAEKPADSAIMSAIMQTSTFPPDDPWLSGYSINYYYFGQVLGAVLAMSAHTNNTAGYNLWTAMIFALAALSTFGVVYDLVSSRRASARTAIAFAVLGVVVVNIMSNYEFPLVELPYQTGTASPAYLDFWDVRGRETPRTVGADTSIGTWSHNWWFNASRAIKDRVVPNTFSGDYSDSIDEFPAFSYLQSDNHAHVIALFFSILIVGLGFNLLVQERQPGFSQIVFYGLMLGSLYFVNTWSYPVGVFVIVGAEVLRRLTGRKRLTLRAGIDLLIFIAVLVVVSQIAYLPFIAQFKPNATGLLPNLYQGTRLQQMALAQGALLPLTILYVGVHAYRASRQRAASWLFALLTTVAVGVCLIALTAILTQRELTRTNFDAYSLVNGLGSLPNWTDFVPLMTRFRLEGLPTLILLFALLMMTIAVLLPKPERDLVPLAYAPAARLVLLLFGLGIGLLILPEFVYVFDIWGHRGTTVFKFYIQVWIFLGIAVTYGLYSLLADREQRITHRAPRLWFGCLSAALILLGLPYFAAATWTRGIWETRRLGAQPPPLTLDGGKSLVTDDDYITLRCLQDRVRQADVVVASGVYGRAERYSYFYNAPGLGSGRVGALTGIPTLLGWGMHELNWKVEPDQTALETRVEDTRQLYTATNLAAVRLIIERYGIDYIAYGDVERHPYWYGTTGEQKFLAAFPVVCQSGESRIFQIQ